MAEASLPRRKALHRRKIKDDEDSEEELATQHLADESSAHDNAPKVPDSFDDNYKTKEQLEKEISELEQKLGMKKKKN